MDASGDEMNPNVRLQPATLSGVQFGIIDIEKYNMALKLLRESLHDQCVPSMLCADNIITWNRNLSFMREEPFSAMLQDPNRDEIEKSTIWRCYILHYFAQLTLDLDGDFMECGCYKGTTAKDLLVEHDLRKYGKKYWLYDLFEWNNGDDHTQLAEHDNPKMYEDVVARFSEYENVKIIKGFVPESFSEGFPDSIAFCHIDMNHPVPESGALEAVMPKLVKGGIVIFDDYGWWNYSAQKIALDKIALSFGHKILELPTGQGILIKK